MFNDANFSVNGKAFIRMPMKDLKYFAEFLDESGMPFVGGSVSWSGGATARIDENSVTETDGKLIYKTQFTYTPDSTITKYENYSPTTFDVEFEVEQPKFVFNMDGILPIHVVGEYDRSYNVSVIAAEFEKAFLEKLSAGDPVYDKVKKLVPCFDGVEISTYRDGRHKRYIKRQSLNSRNLRRQNIYRYL